MKEYLYKYGDDKKKRRRRRPAATTTITRMVVVVVIILNSKYCKGYWLCTICMVLQRYDFIILQDGYIWFSDYYISTIQRKRSVPSMRP